MERSAAMKAPVGLLSGRAVCVSRWRGFAPTSSAELSKRIFTGRVMEGNGICSAAFCESAALRGSTPSVIAYGDATFPKGTAFRIAAKFPSSQKASPWGSWLCAAKTEGVYLFRFYFCFSAQNVLRAGFSS